MLLVPVGQADRRPPSVCMRPRLRRLGSTPKQSVVRSPKRRSGEPVGYLAQLDRLGRPPLADLVEPAVHDQRLTGDETCLRAG